MAQIPGEKMFDLISSLNNQVEQGGRRGARRSGRPGNIGAPCRPWDSGGSW